MAVLEFGSLPVDGARGSEPSSPCLPGAPAILDTTELRWFVPGSVPAEIGDWFAGSTGVFQERCDAYLVNGRSDVGVKRRFRATLELKRRQCLDGWIDLGAGLAGSLEVWRRWSPAEGLVDDVADGRWVDVCKSIVKRRFSIDGTEMAFTSSTQTSGAGCDVEVADVAVGDLRGWTFAFAAFGPPATRRAAVLGSWQGLVGASGCSGSFAPCVGRAMGYPEWLARMISPDRPEQRRHRALVQSH